MSLFNTIKITLLIMYLGICSSTWSNNTKALIISIGEYPENSGWEFIHANNDALLIKKTLKEKGVDSKDIFILSEQHATYYNIIQQLQNLYTSVQQGDKVYLHFSCHGQQMADNNGDEEDGLDEALIPYDALFWFLPQQYEGEKHLRDDELGVWIQKLRQKAGPNGTILIVLDACHSGTGHRNPGANCYIRGTSQIFAPEGYQPSNSRNSKLQLPLSPHPEWAAVMVISACQADETNIEYYEADKKMFYGRLSYCISEIISQWHTPMQPAQLYKLIIEKMHQLPTRGSHHWQTPYAEFSNPNQLLVFP